MKYVEYNSNNSGGRWWLSDEDWKALEAAGWKVEWVAEDPFWSERAKDGRWLGALARSARREGLSLQAAVAEWESATGLSSTAAGCSCCGQPHDFTEYDAEGKYVDRGPSARYTVDWD